MTDKNGGSFVPKGNQSLQNNATTSQKPVATTPTKPPVQKPITAPLKPGERREISIDDLDKLGRRPGGNVPGVNW